MRIVYVASGIVVPGSYGGATHTLEVARNLSALGHSVDVVARAPRSGMRDKPRTRRVAIDGFTIHYVDLPKALGLLSYPYVEHLVRALRPHALMERYYNLAGAGILAAQRHAVPSLLEVNALIVDPPAVPKRRVDDRLGRPLRRWATAQCRMAARIVTPLATTVPAEIPRDKIVELPWGANIERFDRDTPDLDTQALRVALGIPAGRPVLAFLGSFRVWHGVLDFVHAALRLLDAGEDIHLLLIGDGPERQRAVAAARPHAGRFCFAGSVPNEHVPRYLALAGIGVAPFNTAPHPALRAAGFFWSPLKIYEYMAMGLPVVTTRIPPLDRTIRDGQEGALFRDGDLDDLAAAIRRVLHSPMRAEMGRRARLRVEQCFSWRRHCEALERVLETMAAAT